MTPRDDFWSRRRAGVAAEAEAEDVAVEARALAEEHAALEEKSDAEILAELNLPDPDTMEQGDDFSAFMAKVVPDRIRRRALRVLWRSNPVLANVDMLVDYGEDFTDKAMVIENLQTTYQVGKGMVKHVQEMARQAEEKAKALADALDAPEEDAAPETADDTDEVLLSAVPAHEAPDVTQAPAYVDPLDAPDTETADETPKPRRMKFRIEETA